jgi:hypothetical protein
MLNVMKQKNRMHFIFMNVILMLYLVREFFVWKYFLFNHHGPIIVNLNLAFMKKKHIGRLLAALLLVSICVFGFISSGKADFATSSDPPFIDPEDMVQGEYYFFWDHGSGASVVQHERLESDVIYSSYAITPSQSSFAANSQRTVNAAGNIQAASLGQIMHLQRCKNAGAYVP